MLSTQEIIIYSIEIIANVSTILLMLLYLKNRKEFIFCFIPIPFLLHLYPTSLSETPKLWYVCLTILLTLLCWVKYKVQLLATPAAIVAVVFVLLDIPEIIFNYEFMTAFKCLLSDYFYAVLLVTLFLFHIMCAIICLVSFIRNMKYIEKISYEPRDPSILEEELLKIENIPLGIVGIIVSCSIYKWYWAYILCRRIKLLNMEYDSFLKEYLCLLFVPFYIWYWLYTRGKKLSYAANRIGFDIRDRSELYFATGLLGAGVGAISLAVIQNDLNRIANYLNTLKNKETAIKEQLRY